LRYLSFVDAIEEWAVMNQEARPTPFGSGSEEERPIKAEYLHLRNPAAPIALNGDPKFRPSIACFDDKFTCAVPVERADCAPYDQDGLVQFALSSLMIFLKATLDVDPLDVELGLLPLKHFGRPKPFAQRRCLHFARCELFLKILEILKRSMSIKKAEYLAPLGIEFCRTSLAVSNSFLYFGNLLLKPDATVLNNRLMEGFDFFESALGHVRQFNPNRLVKPNNIVALGQMLLTQRILKVCERLF
jgi:hypothetical protein